MQASPRNSSKPVKPQRWTRHLPWIGGAVLVVLIVVGLWPKAQPVETAIVARGPLRVTVDEEGMTRVKNRYTISSPVGGLLRRIDWKPGAVVEAGKTVIAILDTREGDLLDSRTRAQAEARVQAANAVLAQAAAQQQSAEAAATLARTEYERIQKLYAAGSVSQQQLDIAELNHTRTAQDERAAGFAQQVAQFELQQAQAILQRNDAGGANNEPLIITSPVSGRILKVFQESERVVPAAFPLVEVGDATDLEARIEVLSRDAVGIHPGAAVELVKWGGNQPLHGHVRVVEPAAFTKISALGVEEQRVYVVVDFDGPPAERPTLGDSYRVEARIVSWESADVLKVPAGALFQRGNTWQTYVLSGGRARLTTVGIGPSNGLETAIVNGLSAGDEVIVYPGDRIADGVRVAPMTVATH